MMMKRQLELRKEETSAIHAYALVFAAFRTHFEVTPGNAMPLKPNSKTCEYPSML